MSEQFVNEDNLLIAELSKSNFFNAPDPQKSSPTNSVDNSSVCTLSPTKEASNEDILRAENEELRKENICLREKLDAFKQAKSSESVDLIPALTLIDLPKQVAQMSAELQRDSYLLFSMYDQWLAIVKWQKELLLQVKGQSSHQNKSIHLAIDKNGTSGNQVKRCTEIIQQQCACAVQLGEEIATQLWQNVQNCVILAQRQPTVLRNTFRIIATSTGQSNLSDSSDDKKEALASLCGQYQTIQERMFVELKNTIEATAQESSIFLTDDSNVRSPRNMVDNTTIIGQMNVVKDIILDVFESCNDCVEEEELSPGYILSFFKDMVLQETQKQLDVLITNLDAMSVFTVFRVVTWLEKIKSDAKEMNLLHMSTSANGVEVEKSLATILENMDEKFSQVYLNMIQMQIGDAKEDLLRRNYTPRAAHDGHFYSNSVDDLVGFVVQQISFLKKYLNGKRLREATHLCLSILKAGQQHQLEELSSINNSNLKNVPMGYLEQLCVIVNDSYRIQDQMKEIVDVCKEKMHKDELDYLQVALGEIGTGYDKVSFEGLHAISRFIVRDLDDTIMFFFSNRWLNNMVAPISTALATFNDYFIDIEKWVLKSSSLSTLKSVCISRLVKLYIERLFNHSVCLSTLKNDPKHRSDMNRFAEQLLKDYFTLQNYSLQCLDGLPATGGISQQGLLVDLGVVELISRFFSSPDPSLVFQEVAEEFGSSTKIVLSILIKLRSDLTLEQQSKLQNQVTKYETWAKEHAPPIRRFRIEVEKKMLSNGNGTPRKKSGHKADQFHNKSKRSSLFEKAKRSSIAKGMNNVAKKGKAAVHKIESYRPTST